MVDQEPEYTYSLCVVLMYYEWFCYMFFIFQMLYWNPTIELATLEFGSHPHTWSILVYRSVQVDAMHFDPSCCSFLPLWAQSWIYRSDRRCLGERVSTSPDIAAWTVDAGVPSRERDFGTESSSKRVERPTIMHLSSFQACSPLEWRAVAIF